MKNVERDLFWSPFLSFFLSWLYRLVSALLTVNTPHAFHIIRARTNPICAYWIKAYLVCFRLVVFLFAWVPSGSLCARYAQFCYVCCCFSLFSSSPYCHSSTFVTVCNYFSENTTNKHANQYQKRKQTELKINKIHNTPKKKQ